MACNGSALACDRSGDARPPSRRTLHSIRRVALLVDWYAADHRDFPWRGTHDPYAVLVSEVMLQQTQASRVAERFPRVPGPLSDASRAGGRGDRRPCWPSGAGSATTAAPSRCRRRRRSCERDGWPARRRRAGAAPGHRAVHGASGRLARLRAARRGGRHERRDAGSFAASASRIEPTRAPGSWPMRWPRPDARAEWPPGRTRAWSSAPRSAAPARPAATPAPLRAAAHRAARRPTSRSLRQPPLRGSDRAYRGAVVRDLTVAPGHSLGDREARDGVGARREAHRPGTRRSRAGSESSRGLERDGLVHRAEAGLRLGAATIGP